MERPSVEPASGGAHADGDPRVLPWRRHSQPPTMEVQEIIEQYRRFHPKRPTDAITEAYRIAAGSHKGQLRRSGEPYITHPLAVAGIVARYGMDDVTICAALLHDAVEDTVLTLDEVEEHFGPGCARSSTASPSWSGSTSTPRRPSRPPPCARCWWRWPRTSGCWSSSCRTACTTCGPWPRCPAWKQERTAQETLDIYAPLAHRLGMQEIKQQLEDLCFAALHPKRYAEIDHMVAHPGPGARRLPAGRAGRGAAAAWPTSTSPRT